ncbi:hypothetical protein COEREDRAFT_87753 [Coemansia reversa NRRL 1564]|uniref:Uncharacterized protein n=1 Tax=Coemansia reversa (strain ATCC 12441 / NRRL 1564) TaxID=763665 RepID=A0A2G5B980_COERN|nr:hypothetical protein COEREDRAFT_87753 [Coemansia reversa NRRL 1564]|eukprot:PIA15568.1 hypothetical protein COEREDRAFT_87753 [Coemansia reversa NRRL 1564]
MWAFYYTTYIPALILALASATAALQIALEWKLDAGTRSITSASSLLRISNNTAPPQTEWLALGWEYGSLGLQRRPGSDSVVMQLTPPSSNFQAIVGHATASVNARHRLAADKDHPPQVLLESPLQIDPALEYYFKVQAHHDLGLNRTTYEGLYSTGDLWHYLGSLVLQHPIDAVTTTYTTANNVSPKETPAALSHFVSSEEISLSQKKSSVKEEERIGSGSDSERDPGSDTEHSDDVWVPRSHKEMFAEPAYDYSEGIGSFRNSAQSYFTHAGQQAFPLSFNHESTSSVSTIKTASISLLELNGHKSVLSVASQKSPKTRLTNEIIFPKVSAFPHLFSGIQRLDDGDKSLLRAGVFKIIQLRDRLGENFHVTNAHAFVYNAKNDDVAVARHYVLASSYQLSIDGVRPNATVSSTLESTSSILSTLSSSSTTATKMDDKPTGLITKPAGESDAQNASSLKS